MLMNMLTVSSLKLDMGFIRSVGSDERTNCVVSSIVRMAKWLEMSVVAEGAETQTHVDYLRSIGCDRVQGYYFSRCSQGRFLSPCLSATGRLPRSSGSGFSTRRRTPEAVWDAVKSYDRMMRGRMDAAAMFEQFGDAAESSA